jgi:hypothetical protein
MTPHAWSIGIASQGKLHPLPSIGTPRGTCLSRTGFDHPAYLERRGLRLDAREHPCRDRGFPRRNVGSGRHLYDEIEGVLAPGALLPNRFGEFGELLRFGEIDREQSVPSSRAPDRAPIGRLTRGERTRSRLGLATVWAPGAHGTIGVCVRAW